jgi:hypothetical protein
MPLHHRACGVTIAVTVRWLSAGGSGSIVRPFDAAHWGPDADLDQCAQRPSVEPPAVECCLYLVPGGVWSTAQAVRGPVSPPGEMPSPPGSRSRGALKSGVRRALCASSGGGRGPSRLMWSRALRLRWSRASPWRCAVSRGSPRPARGWWSSRVVRRAVEGQLVRGGVAFLAPCAARSRVRLRRGGCLSLSEHVEPARRERGARPNATFDGHTAQATTHRRRGAFGRRRARRKAHG